jgi:two-component system chemotaxis response regulator CheY
MYQRTILLADPDPEIRSTLRRGLEMMGYGVMEVADGDTALALALRSELALTVTELYVPTGDAICLVRAIRRMPALRRMKVLAYTAFISMGDREWAFAAGADAFLTKPTSVGQLLQVAGRLAQNRSHAGHRALPRETANTSSREAR